MKSNKIGERSVKYHSVLLFFTSLKKNLCYDINKTKKVYTYSRAEKAKSENGCGFSKRKGWEVPESGQKNLQICERKEEGRISK